MKVKLGQLCKINPKSQHIPEDTNVSFVPMSCISEEGRIDASQVCPAREVSKGYTAFAEGDILMAKITPCMENGKGAIAEGLCNGLGFGSTEFHVLRADLSRVSPNWLFRFTKSEKFRRDCAGNMTGSGGQKRVPKSYLEKYSVNLPSLARQREIVRVLDKVEAVIDKHKRQLAKLDELAKARFVEMFAKKYDSVEVGRYLKTTSGGTPATSCPEYYKNGTIPWLTSSEVNSGIISKTKAYITEEGLKNSSAKYIPEDSIVIAMYGATAGQVGLLKIRCTTNQAVCAILPSERFLPAFLYYNAQYNKPWMLSQCAGGAQKNISQRIIRRMALYDAPLPLQRQFAEFVTHIERMKGKVRASLEATQKLLGSLMQEYFS